MKKTLGIAAAASLFAVGAFAAETASAGAVAEPDAAMELEEIDDSAEAARRPSVKIAAPPQADVLAAQTEGGAALSPTEESLVDIACDEATLADILRQFRKTTGANIISGDSTNLQRRVSVSLNHVPWMQALQSILNSRGFRLEPRQGIYFVSEDTQLDPTFTRTYPLNHASADDLAKLFNATYSGKDAKGQTLRPVASSFPGANVVVVTATESVLRDCEKIIESVDKAVPQVYIEARFIELSNEAMQKLGMDWSTLSSWGATVKGLNAGIEYNNGRVGNYWSRLKSESITDNRTSGEGTSSATSSISREYEGVFPKEINQADGANRTASSMAWRNARGFSGQLSVDDFRLAMSAFEQLGEGRIFSNPKIIVSNGKEAKVDMTTKYPNVTIESDFTGQNQNSLSVSTRMDVIPGEDKQMFAHEAFFSWGIMLTVKPRISPDGLINVEIVPTISDCTGYASVQSNQDSDTPYTRYPIIEVKRLTTDFTMKDGSTAVIGGLSKTEEEDIDSGIPYLRKIPYLGQKLFGWKKRAKVQKEIVVFVTVGIANPAQMDKDVGLPKNAIMGREYVDGTRLEPGDRANAAAEFRTLDQRPLDDRGEAEPRKGAVVITPVAAKPPAAEKQEAEIEPIEIDVPAASPAAASAEAKSADEMLEI